MSRLVFQSRDFYKHFLLNDLFMLYIWYEIQYHRCYLCAYE